MRDRERNRLTASIIAAYVSHNAVPVARLQTLISNVDQAITELDGEGKPSFKEHFRAATLKQSIFPDYLVCLEDGKRLTSMKRHLRSLGLTPSEYRKKWGLPLDYPMVAPNYAAKRSAMARAIGLGGSRAK